MNWLQHIEAAENHFKREVERATDPALRQAAIDDLRACEQLIIDIQNGHTHEQGTDHIQRGVSNERCNQGA